jgi:hypothetical protein
MFTIATELLELRLAIRADRIAKAAARQSGIDATLPLTESRLGELCELGERMRSTEARLEAARSTYSRNHAQTTSRRASQPDAQ